jgi:hypothetical protein
MQDEMLCAAENPEVCTQWRYSLLMQGLDGILSTCVTQSYKLRPERKTTMDRVACVTIHIEVFVFLEVRA